MSSLLNNRYHILKTLGTGGCGETSLAQDTYLPSGRRCVIKRLKPKSSNPATYQIIKERFQREAAVLEKLGEACNQIPSLYAYFTEDREFYLVQEWVEGQNLMQTLKERGPFSESNVISLLLSLLPVLDYVHAQGIIHRDIKPENIMLRGNDGKPVLIDFGAVKEVVATAVGTRSGALTSSIVIGSPGFMPVEQVGGKPVFASDLYSLGLTAICLLTGKRPQQFTDLSTGGVCWREYETNVSHELAAILEKAINPFARERYQTAREMLEALHSVDRISESTITKKHAPAHAVQRFHSFSSIPTNEISPDRAPSHFERGKSRAHSVYVAVFIVTVLLTAGIASFYANKNTASSSVLDSINSNGSAYHMRPNTQNNSNQAPSTISRSTAQTGNFEVVKTNDGFTSVRASSTTRSAEIGRLYPRTKITCQYTVKGESLWENDEWRYCPSVGGYVHSKLLFQTR